jgi:hypothetical protein
MYARNYAKWCMPLSENFAWWMVKRYHNRADLTLVTSPQARLVFCSSRVPSRFDWNRGAPRRSVYEPPAWSSGGWRIVSQRPAGTALNRTGA